MRTIIYLSALLIAEAINNTSYLHERPGEIVLLLLIAFAWDMIEMYLKHKK